MAVEVATLQFKADTSDLDQAARKLKKLGKAANDAQKPVGKLNKSVSQSAKSFAKWGLAIAAAAATLAAVKLVAVQRQFDIINSSLVTVTGSTENAAIAFDRIKDFAATTPFDLGQVANAFVQLKAFGLDPSAEALRSYGNTASAMGKDLGQMVQAVANATTGEFEMLKSFGIKARTETDSISFTFRGLTTSVGKNSEEIQAYLLALGKTDFAGAMELRAATLDGALSNLGDSWDQLFLTMSGSGIGSAFEQTARGAERLITAIEKLLSGETTNMERQIELQKELYELYVRRDNLISPSIFSSGFSSGNDQKRLDQTLSSIAEIRNEMNQLSKEAKIQLIDTSTLTQRREDPVLSVTQAEKQLEAQIDAEEMLMEERWARQLAADEAGADVAEAAMEIRTANALMLKQTQMENQLGIAQAGLDMENAAFEQAEEDKLRISQNTNDSILALGDKLLQGKSKNAQAAFQIGMNLANAEKRENAKQILSDSYGAAMKAYKALAGIPIIGPALGAAAAGVIIAAGATYSAESLQGRALGGQVRGNESYMVGERGPEILTMGNMSGNITPNSAITNNSNSNTTNKTANVNFQIIANDTRGFDELLQSRRGHIIGIINEALNDSGREALV